MMRKLKRAVTMGFVAAAIVYGASAGAEARSPALPKQPLLGFSGHMVSTPRHCPAKNGMRIDSVRRGSPAWNMGFERGDIIINIDCMSFNTHKGYMQALRCAGQRPSIILRNVRTGKLVRRSCKLPHARPPQADCEPNPPHTYMLAIDLREDFRRDR